MVKTTKIVLMVFLCSIAMASSAQDLVYTPSKHVSGQILGDISEYNISVNTSTTKAVTYKWKTIENTFKSDWDCSLCDYGGCYPSVPDSGKMIRINMTDAQAGTTGFFKINFLSSITSGVGVLRIYVYDSANYSGGDTISFTMELEQGASVKNEKVLPLKILPNPANNAVNFTTLAVNTSMTLCDLQGRILKEKFMPTTGNQQLTVADLPSGVYFLKLNSSGVIRQSKLIVRH
ncbi:MAG: hypothetical protein COA58_04155 [Bacteroidetes bacterium]|nr:MAG: hypothetical protein COA58_04155 [Bacteroidota bacterium]